MPPKKADVEPPILGVTEEQIAAAKRRIELDQKQDRETPEIVRQLAEMSPGQALDEAIEAQPVVEESSNWEFLNRVPSQEEIKQLLLTLEPWWGVRPYDFADYVQGLPSSKKIKVKKKGSSGREVTIDEYIEVVSVYFSVAGRMQMLRRAQETNQWRVEITPEPVTPTGIPGYLRFDDRLVYREYIDIWAPIGIPRRVGQDVGSGASVDVAEWMHLGRRSGTAWVPAEGGKQAAGSNPYEKVETSARGRALGAWGFGVLPGSGIASLEEMQGRSRNQAALDGEQRSIGAGTGPAAEKENNDPAAMVQEILLASEQIRERSNTTEAYATHRLAKYCLDKLGVNVVKEEDEEGNPISIDLSRLKQGQLAVLRNGMKRTLNTMIEQESL